MTLINISLLVIAGFNFGLALLIYVINHKNKINIYMALSTAFFGAWTFGEAMFREASSTNAAIFWGHFENTAGLLVVFFFYLFSFYFPYQTIKFRKVGPVIAGLFLIISVAIVWSPMYISRIILNTGNNDFLLNFFGILIYFLYFLTVASAGFINLYLKYNKSYGVIKSNIKIVIIATLFTGFFGSFFGVFLPLINGHNNYWFTPYFSLPMIIILTKFILGK